MISMAERFDIFGIYRNTTLTNDGEIKVYFSSFNCEICVHFSQENHNQFYIHENIIGFAKQTDVSAKDGEYSNAKIFSIDLYEDIEKFHLFNAILNKENQISVSLSSIDDIDGFLISLGQSYQDAVESNKKISKNYLDFIDAAREQDFEKLKNYFPVLGYTLYALHI